MTSPAHDLPPVDRLLAERGWLEALARSLVVDTATAEDVSQDATVLALTRPPREPAALRGWLRRVVQNLASNARRAAGRREGRESAAARPEATQDDPSDVVVRWELRREVVDAVLSLDEPYRTTVLLRFFEGLEPDEIAARLGVPRDTVKTRQRRALEMLRARLAHLDNRAGRRGLAVLLVLTRPDGGGGAPVTSGTGAAGGAAKGLVLGGFAMSAMTKTLVGAAVLAVIAAGWWTIRLGDRRDARDGVDTAPATTGAVAAKAGRAKRPGALSAEGAAPTPASFAAADRERDLHGVVLDPDGRPVAGAKVEVLRQRPWSMILSNESGSSPYEVGATQATRDDGTFALRLAPGDDVALRVDAAGFAMWESVWRQAGERVTVRLARAVTLDVVVLDAARTPVAAAVVRVSGGEGAAGRLGRDVATDAAGRMSFDRLPRGTQVNVSVHAPASPSVYQPTNLTDAEHQSLEVVLPAGLRLGGTVIDSVTGNPIAGARVSRQDRFLHAATTGPDGRFTLDGFERGHGAVLFADAPGHARGSCTSAVLTGETGGADVTIALEPAARVTGRVVTLDGAAGAVPVASADVVLLASWRTEGGDGQSLGGVLTGPDGRFDVTGLAPGRAHALRIRAAGSGRVFRRVETVKSAPYAVDLGDVVLPPARTIRGVVVDADDLPIARAEVLLVGPRYDGDPNATRDHRRTDDLGRFAFGDAAPGEFEVEASLEMLRTKVAVTVPDDADPPATRIVLATPAGAAAKYPVRVRVVDEDGNPVAGVNVYAGYIANGGSASAATDDSGRVVLPAEFPPRNLIPSFRDTSLALRFERPRMVHLRPGQTESEIVLRRIGGAAGVEILSGRVVDAAGAAVPYATIGVTVAGRIAEVMHGDGGRAADWAQADAEGRFSLAVPRGATADLIAKPQPDRRDAKRFGELLGARPGEPVEIVVRAPAADRALDVTVVGPDGAALRGALVHVHYDGEDWERPRMSPTDARGAVSFADLPGAPLTVDVILKDPRGRVNISRTLSGARVASNQANLRITVPAARTIRGRVLLPDGAPCGGAVVIASSATCNSMTIAEADGTFALEVHSDEVLPLSVYAYPLPPDAAKPLAGWDLGESFDQELEIRLGPVPKR